MMLSFVALTGAWAQQWIFLEFNPHVEAYKLLLRDLVAMRKATRLDPVEGAVLDGLINVVPLAVERCNAARDLLVVLGLVHSEEDKKDVAHIVRLRLGQHAESFDELVERANSNLVHTKSAGTAATAERLKDQLRATKALIERFRPPQ